jgi:hypothetical protein
VASSGALLIALLVGRPSHRHHRRLQLAYRLARFLPMIYISCRARDAYPELLRAADSRPAPIKATLLLLLLHPLLAIMASATSPVDYEQHLALTPALLAVDLLVLAPLAGCALTQLGLAQQLAAPCRALQLAASALYGVASDGARPRALCSQAAALFMPAFCYALLGLLLPLLAGYWAEAGLEARFLAAQQQGRLAAAAAAAAPPLGAPPRALLLGQLYAALALALGLAMVASGDLVWAPGGGHRCYCAGGW